MKLRARFTCQSVTLHKDTGEANFTTVSAVDEETKEFFKYTPYGELKLGVLNLDVAGPLKPGQDYYVILEPVEADDAEGE